MFANCPTRAGPPIASLDSLNPIRPPAEIPALERKYVKRGSICKHPSRPEIDRGLMHGARLSALAGQFGRRASALCRHTQPPAGAL